MADPQNSNVLPFPARDNYTPEPAGPTESRQPLQKGGGGDNFDGMEKRIDKLDAAVDSLRKDLTDIKVMLARMEADLSHKIDYKWMSAYVIGLAMLMLREEIAALFK